MTKSVFRQESGVDIVWCWKRGEKCAARNLRFLCAQGAHSCVPLCKGLLSWFRKYHKRYFPHNKKEPCDRVRIGCAFVLLIWLCLRQWSLLESPLRSGSYRVHLCTIDLIVFEARKPVAKNPAIGFVSGAPLHYWFDCVWSKEVCWKVPCDWVRIGCAFALLIWLCLRQWRGIRLHRGCVSFR